MTTLTYRREDVPVDGGLLRVGLWESVGSLPAQTPTVIALHGVTANHMAFRALAAALSEVLPVVRLIAPDLRGRGGSNALPGPYGMPRHADDVATVAAHYGVGRAVVAGHSMGGFASVVLAHRHPALVDRLVLIDGGIPLRLPAGVDPDAAMRSILGPAAQRLTMTFADRDAYQAFWRDHPAFREDWSADVAAYFDYDLQPADGGYRPTTAVEAFTEDQRELYTGASLLPAVRELSVPTTLLRAPAGLMADAPLYEEEYLADWVQHLPTATVTTVPDVNHYTIVMAPRGARVVAQHLADAARHAG